MRKNFLAWEEEKEGRGVLVTTDPGNANDEININDDEAAETEQAVGQWYDWEYTERGREYVRKHVFDANGVMSSYRKQQQDKRSDKDKDKDSTLRKGSSGNGSNDAGGGDSGRNSGGGGGGSKARSDEVIAKDFPSLLALLGIDHKDMSLMDPRDHKRGGKGGEMLSGEGLSGALDTGVSISATDGCDGCEGQPPRVVSQSQSQSQSLSLSSLLAMRNRLANHNNTSYPHTLDPDFFLPFYLIVP